MRACLLACFFSADACLHSTQRKWRRTRQSFCASSKRRWPRSTRTSLHSLEASTAQAQCLWVRSSCLFLSVRITNAKLCIIQSTLIRSVRRTSAFITSASRSRSAKAFHPSRWATRNPEECVVFFFPLCLACSCHHTQSRFLGARCYHDALPHIASRSHELWLPPGRRSQPRHGLE